MTLLASVAAAAFHPIYAVDFFWHLKLGEVITETHAIPRTNLFSSAEPGRAYVQFNWLWDLGAARIVQAFGLHGFRVAQSLLLAASFLWLYLRAKALSRSVAAASFVTTLGFVLFEDRFQERPSALLIGFFAAILPLLLGGYRQAGARMYGWAALVAVLWANMHGGETLLLLCSTGALLCGELYVRWRFPERTAATKQAAVLLGTTALALVTSPTALPGMWNWAHAIGPQIAVGNEEWQPTYTMLRNGLRPAFLIIALGPTLVGLVYSISELRRVRRDGRAAADPTEWLLCAGYLVLAHQAVRNAFLCLLPLTFMLQRAARTGLSRQQRVGLAAAAVILLGIALEDALPYSYGGLERIAPLMAQDVSPEEFPVLVTDFLNEAEIEGGMINDGRWGGYLIYRTWPRNSVFADTRHHFTESMWTVFMASHDAIMRAQAVDAAFERWGIELAVFRGPSFPLLKPPPKWRLLYKAGDHEVYQHVDGKHAAQNVRRTIDWLRKQRVLVRDDVTADELATYGTIVGAAHYFAQPDRRALVDAAVRAEHSTDARVAGEGARDHGQLLYRAGMYKHAAALLDRGLADGGFDAQSAYCAAFAHYVTGARERSIEVTRTLLKQPEGLNARQRDRLALLAAELGMPDAPKIPGLPPGSRIGP